MKVGLVGYQGGGKSSLFEWITQTAADVSLAHTSQTAMAPVADPRVDRLREIYQPKKVTLASLEVVDTPGLDRGHEGNAPRLALIREADCLVQVVATFRGEDPWADIRSLHDDLLLADLEIVSGRVTRLEEALRKPRPSRQQQELELEALRPLLARLEEGHSLSAVELTDAQKLATRSFRMLTEKQRMAILNLPDDQPDASSYALPKDIHVPVVGIPVGLERELARISPQEAIQFRQEMGVGTADRDGLLRQLMDLSGQMLFFTAGPKEVRTWMIPKGATAVEAAEVIHSDLARGFIRAEVMPCDALIRLGSERELKAQGLHHQEPKDYVVQEGDVLHIRFSV